MITATFGFRAPVAIEVAIALAVSWNPFVKSNENPMMTTRTRMKVELIRRAACQQTLGPVLTGCNWAVPIRSR